MKRTKRPHVICHMVPSIDGRIVVDGWKLGRGMHAEYERTAGTFHADAWIIGRVSMEPFAGRARVPAARSHERIARTDYVAPHDARTYAIAIDPSGKLRWRASDIDGEHVITVLTEAVSDRYLAFLRSRGVSYLFGGKRAIDLARVLEKLRARFGIERVLLEGGGKINGSFHAADVVDEISVLVAPVVDGNTGTPTLFDARGVVPARPYALVSVTKRPSDLVWLRYRRKR